MIPGGARGVGHLAMRIMQDLMPKAGEVYMATDLAYLTILMNLIAQDYERAADVMAKEDEEITAILRRAAPVLVNKALEERIIAALDGKPSSLRVSDLTARSDKLLTLLIDIHAATELADAEDASWARILNDDIWRFLERHVARRAYEVPI